MFFRRNPGKKSELKKMRSFWKREKKNQWKKAPVRAIRGQSNRRKGKRKNNAPEWEHTGQEKKKPARKARSAKKRSAGGGREPEEIPLTVKQKKTHHISDQFHRSREGHHGH